ncbi:hypothetical protein [Allomuricauda sp. ARW1Y1]|jgi:hypothetical protein|uniref:hypothetical protein n=1 Tax=Allomuricauda sp. ARW1Y1 TaxID=2663843 RepID=UPI0015C756F7|nr:hypothetical protein [Muricauda sp. ARW1Y1]NYJ27070.1 hypothetical protein [Muricauda sp. ARW1Y1]
MSSPNKRNSRYKGPKTYVATDGLDDFLKVLEKYFFATAKVQCKQDFQNNRTDLIIHLHHNFGIAECLRHFNDGNWGSYDFAEDCQSSISTKLAKALETLNQESTYPTDILELSLHFEDTSIIISRLFKHSITEQASDILTAVGKHFVYFTKGLTEMPYEIFVPVFEDTATVGTSGSTQEEDNPISYFDYWGLYFDRGDGQEAYIYSLHQKKLYEESIFLFE